MVESELLIPKKLHVGLLLSSACERLVCKVCKNMILILIAKTGSIGANISQIIDFASTLPSLSQSEKPSHDIQTSLPRRAKTIPSGINAMIARKRTTLMIRTTARATSGIKSARLTAPLRRNSVNAQSSGFLAAPLLR